MTTLEKIKRLKKEVDKLRYRVEQRSSFDEAEARGGTAFANDVPFKDNPYRGPDSVNTRLNESCAALWDWAYIETAESWYLHKMLSCTSLCFECDKDRWCPECDGRGVQINFDALYEIISNIERFRDEVERVYEGLAA